MDDTEQKLWDSWFEDGSFTTDWSSRAFKDWHEHLNGLREKPIEILEIGSWEGRSSIFFLNYFPLSRIDCVDIFLLGNEGLFDSNVMQKYGPRVRKHKSRSTPLLDALATREKKSFDLIYIDGAHERDDVMLDTLLAWRLLRVGGMLIWDDYDILNAMPGVFGKDQDPKPAIDAFLAWKDGEYEIVHSGYQVIVRKTKAHYETEMTLMDPNAQSTSQDDAEPVAKKKSRLGAMVSSLFNRRDH
jgi:hypothetical protein